MNTQTEITIKIDSAIAEAFNQANEAEKQKMIDKITFFLQPIANDKQKAIQKSRKTMTQIGQKAQKRGITPEILEEILNEDE